MVQVYSHRAGSDCLSELALVRFKALLYAKCPLPTTKSKSFFHSLQTVCWGQRDTRRRRKGRYPQLAQGCRCNLLIAIFTEENGLFKKQNLVTEGAVVRLDPFQRRSLTFLPGSLRDDLAMILWVTLLCWSVSTPGSGLGS